MKPLSPGWSPSSVAVLGASDDPDKLGGRSVKFLSQFGYRGAIWPVNTRRREVQGLPAYPSFAELPATPDAVVVAVPRVDAPIAVAEAAAAGVPLAVIMTSGFSETGSDADRAAETHIVEQARSTGMRVVGPNCQGTADFATGVILSFSTMFIEQPPLDGPVGIVSQSGALSGAIYGLVREGAVGVRYVHATGNDADVTSAELLGTIAQDPELRLALLYLENIPDARALSTALNQARDRDLPVIALVGGRTAHGQAAAMSHTGSLANEPRVVSAFLRRHGVYQVDSVAEMADLAPMYLHGWRPRGRSVVAISNSGAVGVLAADSAADFGLPITELSASDAKRLSAVLPAHASARNPIDITSGLLGNPALLSNALGELSTASGVDNVVIGLPVAGVGYDMPRIVSDVRDFCSQSGTPLAVATPQSYVAQLFRRAGVPTFRDIREALAALRGYLDHLELRRTTPRWDGTVPGAEVDLEHVLNEADSMRHLVAAGIPCVRQRLCASVTEAREFRAGVAGPVVLKGCTAAVTHKSDLGLVRIGVDSDDSLRESFDDIRARAAAADVPLDGVLVAEQVSAEAELMIGARLDPVFGPVVVIGLGGTAVEAVDRVEVLLPPLNRADVTMALRRLELDTLAAGIRGSAPWDVDAYADVVVSVGALLADPANTITTVDMNPVMVRSAGQGAVVVDAVVMTSAPPAG